MKFASLVLGCLMLSAGAVADSTAAPQTAPAPAQAAATEGTEVRAVWVTRWNYKTPEDVAKIAENCAAMNFNVILFQVRGEGTVFFKSNIEPWAWELTGEDPSTTGKDPGWDPLAVAVEEAHKHGLELHAWVNVFPGWRSQTYPPESAGQLWTKHPDWFMHDAAGNKMLPRDKDKTPFPTWYSFLSPGVPEVQDYLAKLFEELVANYDVDGLHYDYVRYPAEITEVAAGFEDRAKAMGNWSYDARSLARFQKETGVAGPDANPAKWTEWRAEQITNTVRKIRDRVKTHKPDLIISAAVIPDPDDARARKYQDYVRWMKEDTLDAVITMGYTTNIDTYTSRLNLLASKNPEGYIVSGFGGSYDQDIVLQLMQAGQKIPDVDGYSLFAYGHLVDDNQNLNEKAKALMQGPLAKKAKVPW